jgi:hypothetical protein
VVVRPGFDRRTLLELLHTLGPEDLVLHAGPQALQASPLSAGNFDGRVTIIRATDR